MIWKKVLVVGGTVVALTVPAGVAIANAASPAVSPGPTSTGPAAPGNGPGPGPMMGGYGDPEDCPYYDSDEMRQWREQRADRQSMPSADRQQLIQQHRERMWQLHDGTSS